MNLQHQYSDFPILLQTSSDGNQTTSTLTIVLSHADANKYLSCRAYNHAMPDKSVEDRWRLDIQCNYDFILFLINPIVWTERRDFWVPAFVISSVGKLDQTINLLFSSFYYYFAKLPISYLSPNFNALSNFLPILG